jgi:arginine deiminase
MTEMTATRHTAAAYGGAGWRPRAGTTADEIGTLWAPYAVRSEHSPLRAVLLHRPGDELRAAAADPDACLMLDAPDVTLAGAQHDELAAAYRAEGVGVAFVDPAVSPPPNLMYVADLMFMTPAGAILARPASTVRAGEERWVARRLADLGVPILRSVGGTGVFEGADAMWLDPRTVLLGRGLRTNAAGATQVAATLAELGVRTVQVDLPHSAMHLMGQVRIIDHDLALIQSGHVPWSAVDALREHGYVVSGFPDEAELRHGFAHNFVTLGPRRILMPAGNPRSQAHYAELGIECVTVEIGELQKAAGGIGCLSGVLRRGA